MSSNDAVRPLFGQKFYKITNEKETHKGFKYKTGLNIDTVPFEKEGSCVSGGLYFTTAENLHKFYHYGVYIRSVFIPWEDPGLQIVKDPDGDKWRANILWLRHALPSGKQG
jgi:hypothetical protein